MMHRGSCGRTSNICATLACTISIAEARRVHGPGLGLRRLLLRLFMRRLRYGLLLRFLQPRFQFLRFRWLRLRSGRWFRLRLILIMRVGVGLWRQSW